MKLIFAGLEHGPADVVERVDLLLADLGGDLLLRPALAPEFFSITLPPSIRMTGSPSGTGRST
jgi:hypothetical protein